MTYHNALGVVELDVRGAKVEAFRAWGAANRPHETVHRANFVTFGGRQSEVITILRHLKQLAIKSTQKNFLLKTI